MVCLIADIPCSKLTLTSYAEHPGGSKIILKYAGKDATEAYDPIHPPDAITTNLPTSKQCVVFVLRFASALTRNNSLGVIDASTVEQTVKEVSAEEKRRLELMAARPPIDNILNLHDFEVPYLLS